MAAGSDWVEIGRSLIQDAHSLRKRERVALVRDRAKSLSRSPHTVQRYSVLVGFLERLGFSDAEMTELNAATMEVVLRMHALDPDLAMSTIQELREGRLTHRATMARVKALQPSQEPRELAEVSVPLRRKVTELLGWGSRFEIIDLRNGGQTYLSCPLALFRVDGELCAFVSELDFIARGKRGVLQLTRDAVLATSEAEYVFVMFAEPKSARKFKANTRTLRPGVLDQIKTFNLTDLHD